MSEDEIFWIISRITRYILELDGINSDKKGREQTCQFIKDRNVGTNEEQRKEEKVERIF